MSGLQMKMNISVVPVWIHCALLLRLKDLETTPYTNINDSSESFKKTVSKIEHDRTAFTHPWKDCNHSQFPMNTR